MRVNPFPAAVILEVMDSMRPATDDSSASTGEDPVESIVADVLERFDVEGAAAIDAACAAHPEHADKIRRRCALLDRLGLVSRRVSDELPQTFGRYRILERLGAGGMGVVYLAMDERLGRRVALKASGPRISTSARARARFDREVRAAAQLEHPHIVPIFDVGEEQGTPYYTMQYVEGATLAAIIRALKAEGRPFADLTARDVRRAIEASRPGVFPDAARSESSRSEGDARDKTYVETVCRIVLDVADALAHAHDHGVIHRDVKPSNILIDREGRAQLFDLGLAHLDDEPALTLSGDFAGTPQYVSPEQIAGKTANIDRRTDVYSLGVTFYELLTLRAPFTARNTHALLRQIQMKEPPLLRRHNPIVPRDLETICLTAMEKDRERRYASAVEMADDLRRFLEFKPVTARPAGPLLRGWRFLRRNPALGASIALAMIVAIGAPLGLLIANALIRVQRDRAETAAREARALAGQTEQVAEFMVDLFREPDLTGAGAEVVTAREILERGAQRIERALDTQPLVQAAFMETLGRAYANLGLHDRALRLCNRALAIRERELGEGHVDVARLLQTLASVHFAQENDAIAEALARRAESAFHRAGLAAHPDAAGCALLLGEVAARRSDFALASTEFARALAIERAALGNEDRVVADTLQRMAMLELERPPASADLGRAETLFQEALAIRRMDWDPSLADVAASLSGLGQLRARRGDVAGAIDHLEGALAVRTELHGAAHPAVGSLLQNLLSLESSVSVRRGRWLHLRAEGERVSGDATAASATYRESIDVLRATLGESHPDVARSRVGLARALSANGDCDVADAELGAARGVLDAVTADDPRTLRELSHAEEALGRCYESSGSTAESTVHREASVALARRCEALELVRADDVRADASNAAFDERFQTGISALQSGRYSEAVVAFEECLVLEPRHATSAYNIACAQSLLGEIDAAFRSLERAIDLGFGYRATAVQNATKDADLANLRRDARFLAVIERMTLLRRAAEEYASQPATYVPARVASAEALPVLIVLHADGSTKDEIVHGEWRELADRLGLALVAPSAGTPTGLDPSQGMSWNDPRDGDFDLAADDAKRVSDALRAFRASHRVDRSQILLAGEGRGGQEAFRIASRVPGLFRGVLLRGAVVEPRRSATAALRGLRVAVRIDRGAPIVGLRAASDLERWGSTFEQHCAELGASADFRIGSTKDDLAAALGNLLGR
jgi:serine/threonine protein kinase/predicted esterase